MPDSAIDRLRIPSMRERVTPEERQALLRKFDRLAPFFRD